MTTLTQQIGIRRNFASTEEKNFHHLVMDIFWFGMALPATTRFVSVYAIRVGASPQELGWLSALPAILLFFAALLGIWWQKHYDDAVQAAIMPGFWFRFVFLLPALTPFLPVRWQPFWLIFSLALPSLPQGISNVIFFVVMREAVSKEMQTRLISRRFLAMNTTLGLSTYAIGWWLSQAPYPFNYQAMFIGAFLASLVSLWHVKQTRSIFASTSSRQPFHWSSLRVPLKSAPFRGVMSTAFWLNFAFFMVFPLIPYYLVDEMGADEKYMGLFVLIELVGGAAISLTVPRVLDRLGNYIALPVGLFGLTAAVIAIGLAPTLTLALLGAALTGISWTVANIGLYGCFSNQLPPQNMTPYTTVYNQIIAVAIFSGSLLGTSLTNFDIDIVTVLLVGAGFRLLVGIGLSLYPLLKRKGNIVQAPASS